MAAESDDAVERHRVAVGGVLASSERQRRVLEVAFRFRDPCPARQNLQDRLSRLERALLVEVSDVEALGSPRHDALVRLLEAGDDPEQGRLAHAVRSEQPDAGAWADRERYLVENELGAVVLADAGESYSHGRTSESRVTARETRAQERNEVG